MTKKEKCSDKFGPRLGVNYGFSDRQIYDRCAEQKRNNESTNPFLYQMQMFKHEHCGKCIIDQHWHKNDLVEIESELTNRNRPLSKCDQFHYYPGCGPSQMCRSTFYEQNPKPLNPEVCPSVRNNLPVYTNSGIPLIPRFGCGSNQRK